MADLISLADLKNALRIGLADTSRDAELTKAITDASAAIRMYTDRSFDTTTVTSTRTYHYDGSGVLEIEDAIAVTQVTLDGVVLQSTEYSVEPYGQSVLNWIFLPESKLRTSPQMGFTFNLDTLWWKSLAQPKIVTVAGTWGWPNIPADVQRAAIWTAASFAETARPVISERVSDVSRQYASVVRDAIPGRARDLLEPYVRGRQ